MTSARVVPTSESSAAEPVMVQSFAAPATLPMTPCTNAGPTMSPTVATETKMLRSLTPTSRLFAVSRSARIYRSKGPPPRTRRDPRHGSRNNLPGRRNPRAEARGFLQRRSWSELQLAAVDRVLRVDHARIGVGATVHIVVPGDVVARLQEVVAGLRSVGVTVPAA